MMMFSMDDMVPQNHMLRLIDKAINWNFIYFGLVEEKYCPDNGRPSMDPVMLIKIPFILYLYGIRDKKSMRQTMKEIEVNVAYRWFLGLDMLDPVPHFSTFLERIIPAVSKIQTFLSRSFQRFWKIV
ncbi:MAG: transposase [Lachnospiraceae bacterium]